MNIYIADIGTLAFHFATYRFRQQPRVTPVLLLPEDYFNLSLDRPVDIIYCVTVFEHLNRPLHTAQRFWELLEPGGLLVFDYVKSEGRGLDTLRGVRERNEVLDFIGGKFTVIRGEISKETTVYLTIAQKTC